MESRVDHRIGLEEEMKEEENEVEKRTEASK